MLIAQIIVLLLFVLIVFLFYTYVLAPDHVRLEINDLKLDSYAVYALILVTICGIAWLGVHFSTLTDGIQQR